MEPIAIYIILAIAVTAILMWAMSLALRSNHYNDRYPPHGPYPYPYPPPYSPPSSPDVPIFSMALVILTVFAVFRYCEKREKPNLLPYDDEIVRDNRIGETNNIGGDDEPPPGRLDLAPVEYDIQSDTPAVTPVSSTPIDLYSGYFAQKGAFSSDVNALRAAQSMLINYPGAVWIGVAEMEWEGQNKVLIGPYATEAEAKAAHGASANIKQPKADKLTIYRPE